MPGNLEEMQGIPGSGAESMVKYTMEMIDGARLMTSEAANQTRKFSEHLSKYFDQLAGARSVEEAMRINSEFTTASLEQFFYGVTRMTECCVSITKDAMASGSEATKAAGNPGKAGRAGRGT